MLVLMCVCARARPRLCVCVCVMVTANVEFCYGRSGNELKWNCWLVIMAMIYRFNHRIDSYRTLTALLTDLRDFSEVQFKKRILMALPRPTVHSASLPLATTWPILAWEVCTAIDLFCFIGGTTSFGVARSHINISTQKAGRCIPLSGTLTAPKRNRCDSNFPRAILAPYYRSVPL